MEFSYVKMTLPADIILYLSPNFDKIPTFILALSENQFASTGRYSPFFVILTKFCGR